MFLRFKKFVYQQHVHMVHALLKVQTGSVKDFLNDLCVSSFLRLEKNNKRNTTFEKIWLERIAASVYTFLSSDYLTILNANRLLPNTLIEYYPVG